MLSLRIIFGFANNIIMKQTLKYIYERLIDNMKLAENKYSITIALASGVIVFGSSFLSSQNFFSKTLSAACVIFALISVLYGFFALSAKHIHIRRKRKTRPVKNLMYYADIVKFDEMNYVAEIIRRYNFPKNYKPDEFDYDLARQIISLARIVHLKYLNFNLSLVFLILSVLSGVGLIFFLSLW